MPDVPTHSPRTPAELAINPAFHPRVEAPAEGVPTLNLTDFVDVRALQSVQDSFTALTRLSASIRDAQGQRITRESEQGQPSENHRVLDWLLSDALRSPDAELVAPIIVEGQKLGSLSVDRPIGTGPSPAGKLLAETAGSLGLTPTQIQTLVEKAEELYSPDKGAAVEFLYLIANSLAQICYQESQLRQNVEQLQLLYELSRVLAAQRDLQQVLDTAARSAAEAMNVKSALIRLLDEDGDELMPRSVFNLSQAYLNKGPIVVDLSEIFKQALQGEVVYIPDMTTDPRVLYPEDALREGLTSMLVAAMIYQGQPIGMIQLYTASSRQFSVDQINLLRAIAQLMAAAINSARLDVKRKEAEAVQRQVRLAADVQKRMLPAVAPNLPGFEIAARNVPSFELGGDFYDLIDLQGNLGIAVADVVGKGIAASLLMASVRSSLRAYADDVYDIDEIIRRVNVALVRDTLANEFATLFYGVLDPRNRRLTYCNAGHEPPLLLRNQRLIRLDAGGMIVGVDPYQKYERGLIDLEVGDLLLLFTDGLTDALNFDGKRFGRDRVIKAMRDAEDKSADEALNHILWEMRRFVGLNRSFDDTTLLVIKYTGK